MNQIHYSAGGEQSYQTKCDETYHNVIRKLTKYIAARGESSPTKPNETRPSITSTGNEPNT
jgi:hypothetical protein